MLGVRTDAKSVLKAMCKKLLQKMPITYPVARALSCLDPRNMAASPEQCKTMTRRLLSACVEGGFVVCYKFMLIAHLTVVITKM